MTTNVKILEMLAAEPLSYFAQSSPGLVTLRFRKRDRIFAQATPADALFYIFEGRVRLTVVSHAGREATLALLNPGEFLGEECIARKQSMRVSSAVAMQDSTVIRLDLKTVRDAIQRDSRFVSHFLSTLLSRYVRLQEDLIDHLCHTSEKRLARILLLLGNLDQSPALEAIVPKISQEVLAEMVGTTRARVSYFMNRFREKGHIDYNGEFHIRRSLSSVITEPQE
jgi:CRP/FNR family transcriptional regulator, cyclic AMP receptor protein